MKIAYSFILDRLKERSTWLGVAALAGALDYHFTEIEFDSFVTMMTAVFGCIATFTEDRK